MWGNGSSYEYKLMPILSADFHYKESQAMSHPYSSNFPHTKDVSCGGFESSSLHQGGKLRYVWWPNINADREVVL